MDTLDGRCGDPGCLAYRFDTDAALREGWDVVEGVLYCDLHKAHAAQLALRSAAGKQIREQMAARKVKNNQVAAKHYLTAAEYRAWDEFQSDLANFHRDHGRLAPETLRTLSPMKWLKQYQKNGRIDIEQASESLYETEKKAEATRQWLMDRL